MSKQISYYAVSEDFTKFLDFAMSKDFRILSSKVNSELYDQEGINTPVSISSFDWQNTYMFYLLPKKISPWDVFYHESADPTISQLAAHVSPVIQCIVSACENKNRYRRGRLYINSPEFQPASGDVDPNYAIVVRAFNTLARFIRKWGKLKTERCYIGPQTERLARSGQIFIARTNKRILVYEEGNWKITDLE